MNKKHTGNIIFSLEKEISQKIEYCGLYPIVRIILYSFDRQCNKKNYEGNDQWSGNIVMFYCRMISIFVQWKIHLGTSYLYPSTLFSSNNQNKRIKNSNYETCYLK